MLSIHCPHVPAIVKILKKRLNTSLNGPWSSAAVVAVYGKQAIMIGKRAGKAFEALRRMLRDDGGVTAIEYALIASILGIALVPVLSSTTSGVASLFTSVQGNFDTVWGGG